mgnify:CR=1 FL=1
MVECELSVGRVARVAFTGGADGLNRCTVPSGAFYRIYIVKENFEKIFIFIPDSLDLNPRPAIVTHVGHVIGQANNKTRSNKKNFEKMLDRDRLTC